MAQSERYRRSTRSWLASFPRAAPVVIFLLVAAITFFSVFMIERAEDEQELLRMRATAQSVESALERRAASWASYLRAGAALLSSSDRVDPTTFRGFVDELRLDTDFRGSDGIGWAEVISADQVDQFSQTLEEQGIASVQVRPAPRPGQTRLVPVTYLQPETARNLRAIGFDMYSEPVRRAAMEEALRVVAPTASGRIVLVQEGEGDAPGFLVYMPVFEGEGPGRILKGFIYSPFNAQTFLDSALELEDRGTMGIQLYDGGVVEGSLLASLAPETATGNTLIEEVSVANRAMRLVVESSRATTLTFVSMLTLLFGLAVASLLMFIARLMSKQALEDQAALDWLEEQHSIRDTLTRELNHRVKNTLANVLSLVSLTRNRSDDLDEFADGLDGRIRALSATHDLLTQSDWGTVSVGDIVDAELSTYGASSSGQVIQRGPEVQIAPSNALSLGLALHELGTNAVKYGALGAETGTVSVSWENVGDDLVRIDWVESGGPRVPQVRQRGFGTDLIEKIVAHELRHPVQLTFDEGGVRCVLMVPVREPSEFKIRARPHNDERS